jgi:chromosome segregation ATPase
MGNDIDRLDLARAGLEERLRQVNEDIRGYPQPIAHCDAQLGGLLAERSQILAQIDKLRRMQESLSRE